MSLAYAKQVPFIEDVRRVVIGIGHVNKIIPTVDHNREKDGELRSMIWETMVCHSIRENHEDGFVIPYQRMMEYANEHPEFDRESITVFTPEDTFDEFSYATQHVSYDAVIDILQSCIKAFSIINNCLDEDYSNVLDWLNRQLGVVWEDRGAFPGFDTMLCALEIPQGIIIAKHIQEDMDDDRDIRERLDAVIAHPEKYLGSLIAESITPIIRKTWKNMAKERKELFWLLEKCRGIPHQVRHRYGQKIANEKIIIDLGNENEKVFRLDFFNFCCLLEKPFIFVLYCYIYLYTT